MWLVKSDLKTNSTAFLIKMKSKPLCQKPNSKVEDLLSKIVAYITAMVREVLTDMLAIT